MKFSSFITKTIYGKEHRLFLLLAFWFSLAHIALGPASYARVPDHLDSFASRAALLRPFLSIPEGAPLWQPFITGGIDRLSNMTSLSELGNWLLMLLPIWLGTGLILILGLFLGGWYVYRLCREMFLLPQGVSMLSGALFSFSLIQIDITPYVMGLGIFPWAAYTLEKIITQDVSWQRKSIWLLLSGIIFSLFSSLILTLPFSIVMLGVWFLWVRNLYRPSFYLFFLLFLVPTFVMRVPEVWSLVSNSPLSQRGNIEYFHSSIFNYIGYMRELAQRNILPFLLIIVGWILSKKRESAFLRVTIVVLVLFFLAPAYKPLSTFFGDFLGGLRSFDFSRFYLFVPFFASIGAGLAVGSVPDASRLVLGEGGSERVIPVRKSILVIVSIFLLLFSLSMKWTQFKTWYRFGSYTSNTYSPDVAAAVGTVTKNSPFRVAIITTQKNGVNRNLPQFHGLESIDGYADLTSLRSIEFFRILAKNSKIKSDFYLFSGENMAENAAFQKDATPYISLPLLSLANVQFVFSNIPVTAPGLRLLQTPSSQPYYDWTTMSYPQKVRLKIDENFSGRKLLAYANEDVFSRFFLVKKARVFADGPTLLSELAAASTSTLRREAFLADTDMSGASLPVFSGTKESIEIARYTPDEIKLYVQSDGPSLLIISTNYDPSWKAYVNDNATPIIPAYRTFMAVPLAEPNAVVKLRYEPPYAGWNAWKNIFDSHDV